jgi:colanic acid/amylovoran biosynthesis glycosyltransferase
MVLHGETGLLCAEGDRPALAQHLQTLLRDASTCQRMGSAGLAHAERHFTRDATGRALLECFASLGGLRADGALLSRQPWLRAQLWKRQLTRSLSRVLRHGTPKVHGKSFQLDAFMA